MNLDAVHQAFLWHNFYQLAYLQWCIHTVLQQRQASIVFTYTVGKYRDMNFFLNSRCIIKNIEEKNRIEKMNLFCWRSCWAPRWTCTAGRRRTCHLTQHSSACTAQVLVQQNNDRAGAHYALSHFYFSFPPSSSTLNQVCYRGPAVYKRCGTCPG